MSLKQVTFVNEQSPLTCSQGPKRLRFRGQNKAMSLKQVSLLLNRPLPYSGAETSLFQRYGQGRVF
jgi:hypothetical protein